MKRGVAAEAGSRIPPHRISSPSGIFLKGERGCGRLFVGTPAAPASPGVSGDDRKDANDGTAELVMIKGQQLWIRVRGAPNDPESFDLATWKGYFWEMPRTNSLGETIYIQIAGYLVVETLPEAVKPDELYTK